jgi:uncharacterized SAM-binding protein YcdF (DUF218 family)
VARTPVARFRHRGRRPARGLRLAGRLSIAVALLAVGYLLVTLTQVWLAGRRDDARPADAIVVLGAAQYDGEPSGALRGRLEHARALWSERRAPIIVVTGGKQPGDRTTEGLTGFTWLRQRGVPEEAILVEVDARSTWEALLASELILEERGLRRVLLVSDPYHNLRLSGMAGELGLEAAVSPAPSHVDVPALARETLAVAAGRLVGYGRLERL